MLSGVIMFGGMFVLRAVAAPNVPANQAEPQVHPLITQLQAFLAAGRGRFHIPDLLHVFASSRHGRRFSSQLW